MIRPSHCPGKVGPTDRYGPDAARATPSPGERAQASADPIRAAEALIKLEAREARLLGLDMPTKLAVTEPEGNGIPLEASRLVMDRFDRANAEAVDVTPEPSVRSQQS